MEVTNKLDVVRIKIIKDKELLSETPLDNPEKIVNYLAPLFAELDREVLAVLCLKSNCTAINLSFVSMGTIDMTCTCPREVFKVAILSNAAQVILLHNHPSGSVMPSKEDLAITKRMVEAGELLSIPVSDHIIVGGESGECLSFRSNGYMSDHDLEEQYEKVAQPKRR